MSTSDHLYTLDVAYASNTAPYESDKPIAMAYGFAETVGSSSHFVGQGQLSEIVPLGSDMYFGIFDTANPPGTVTRIEISFAKLSPFSWTTMVFSNEEGDNRIPEYEDNQPSAGCNVMGRWWKLGYFTTINEVTGECTVKVTAQRDSGSQKFQVDPRIIVRGTGAFA
jgi:hypothetical protein